MKMKYTDNSIAPIIAFDFDGTINIGGEESYPICGHPRQFSKEVLNFLYNVGVMVILWTSRDVSIDQDKLSVHDDISHVIKFMKLNKINYSAINKSVQYAPYKYNSRKIYAHMYVDDRAYGFKEFRSNLLSNYSYDGVMINVLYEFLYKILDVDVLNIEAVISDIIKGREINNESFRAIKQKCDQWNK